MDFSHSRMDLLTRAVHSHSQPHFTATAAVALKRLYGTNVTQKHHAALHHNTCNPIAGEYANCKVRPRADFVPLKALSHTRVALSGHTNKTGALHLQRQQQKYNGQATGQVSMLDCSSSIWQLCEEKSRMPQHAIDLARRPCSCCC